MKVSVGRIVVICALLVNAIIVAVGLYMAFWPMTVLVVANQDCGGGIRATDCILNPGKQVTSGQALVYRLNYCKYTRTQAAVSRSLKGTSITYPLPSSTNNVPTGCQTAISRNTIIPIGVEPGTYRLELSATYRVNPLRSITISHESETFTVIRSDATSADVTASVAAGGETAGSTATTSQAAPALSPVPYGTDPVTQEPTQPTATITPTPAPPTQSAPQPGLVAQIVDKVRGVLGL